MIRYQVITMVWPKLHIRVQPTAFHSGYDKPCGRSSVDLFYESFSFACGIISYRARFGLTLLELGEHEAKMWEY